MRIQGLIFARNFTRRPDHRYDAHDLSLITPFLDGLPQQFPARVSRHVLVSLWRESCSGSVAVCLRFKMVDPTGEMTSYPCPAPCEGAFLDGDRLCLVVARLDFEFPMPGHYRLDIKLNGGKPQDVFHFAITTALDNDSLPMSEGPIFHSRWPAGLSINRNTGVVTNCDQDE